MHILLTDLLTCPRCGPEFGLILLGHRIEERRVLEGELGCPNCREKYPIREGFGDLRAPPRTPLDEDGGVTLPGSGDETTTVAALLGVAEGPGHLALVGSLARHARSLAGTLEGIEVVGISPSLRGWSEEEGVSRIAAAPRLPFFSRKLRGVALQGSAADEFLDEAARVVGPRSRVAVLGAPDGTRDRLEARGLETVLDDRGAVVAVRE